MSNLTARIELNNAVSKDYELLHEEMAKQKFFRVIYATDQPSVYYDLPTGEYYSEAFDDISKASAALQTAAEAAIKRSSNYLFKTYEYILTMSNGIRFSLNKNTDKTKIPKSFK